MFWWLKWRHRQRKIPPSTFAFDVIPGQCKDLKKRILGGEDGDPLADRNIKHQQRVESRNIKRELQRLLEENRWVLILGGTGIGKTREAVEVADYFNQLGWTVLYLKPNQWLDIPARMPEEVGTNRKLIFLIDDLNQKMHSSREEISPKAEKSPVEKFTVPLQERLLDTLERYEYFCGQGEVRVIATARNEKQSYFPGESSPWEKLQWEKYPKLWKKFQVYELPAPSNDAIVEILAVTATEANIQSQPEDYPELARRNDATFSNAIENLRRCSVDRLPLTPNNYKDSLKGSWEKRYDNAVKRYPASEYVYDAIDLLQQFDIVLQRFTVEPTARIIAGGSFWQRLGNYWQIRKATKFLIDPTNFPIDVQGNLKPRDGQIEAKGYQVNAGEFVSPLLRLVFKLADKHREQMLGSVFGIGINLRYLGLLEKSIKCWDKAIEIKPDHYRAWNNRGNALASLGRYEDAIASYDKAIEFKPDYHEAWNNRGLSLGKLGRNKEAIASYDKAIEFKPDYHEAWNNRGVSLADLRRHEEAIASYDKAIEIKPDNYKAWYNWGLSLGKLGRHEEAIASYDKAIELQPDFDQALYDRGLSLGILGRYEDAIASFDQVIELQPDFDQALYDRGLSLGVLGRHEDAIASYDKAIEFKPDNYKAWYKRGVSLANLGRYEDAIASFDKAIDIKPDEDQAWNNRGVSLANLGRNEDAIASYDKAIEFKPDYHEAWNNRGVSLGKLGRHEDAIASYDKAIEFKPDYHQVWYKRSVSLGNLGRYEDAIASYDKAIEFKPNNYKAWYDRGVCLSILERYEDAIASYDKVIEIKPDFGQAWYNRACTYSLFNDIETAIEHLQEAINLNPECREMAKTDSDFDAIRDDERFAALLQEE